MAKRGSTKTAIAYLRCSTDVERQALGVEAQRAAIERWAAKEGVGVLAWHTEEVSGGAPLERRPVLLAALADVAARRAGVLVVAKLDRFSRDPMTAGLAEAELQRHGARLAMADGAGNGSDPTAQLVRDMLLAAARFERAMIAARIKAALAVKQTRGEMTGAPRFGYRLAEDGVHVEADDAEQATLMRVAALRAAGATERGIVAALAAEGVTGRAGRALTKTAIHNMLARAAA